jgi:hypothetical protein
MQNRLATTRAPTLSRTIQIRSDIVRRTAANRGSDREYER